MRRPAPLLLSLVFFLSGVSALIFETLWFRQAGLAFGNSVWASALVLSSFMAGMAVGNGLAARHGRKLRRPLRFYAGLEIAIAVSGLALVWLLPRSTGFFLLLLGPLLEAPWLLQPVRFVVSFALLAAPAVAMGATLPTLVKVLSGEGHEFGRVLGRLYGWNTLGAVAGAVSSELLWIPLLGVWGSGCAAAAGSLLAAALALGLVGEAARDAASVPAEPPRARIRPTAWRLLLAAFLSGSILLALEVVWFRILVLFVINTSEAFAWMLAVVLAGIGFGGLLAAWLLRVAPRAHESVAALALLSGGVCIVCYAAFPELAQRLGALPFVDPRKILALALGLMFAVSVLSGLLFTFVGKGLHDELGSDTRSAGLVAFANTAGAMLGPLVAGFVLLPRLGMERSVFGLSLAYGVVGLCALRRDSLRPWVGRSVFHVATAAFFVWTVVGFPFGLVHALYGGILSAFFPGHERLLAIREGVTETVAVLRADWMGLPYYYRLVTDSYSMSASDLKSRRYMALFAHLPLAFHGQPREALLISYGVGTTARALVDDGELERIDVVDISREILGTSQLLFPPERNPLFDPRVTVHVEDGRYFLHATPRRYDLITAEPPPPAFAGVVNLYTRDYFELIRARLAEGGLVSYWLPVGQLRPEDAAAIVRGFCEAFDDCSLWEGTPQEWILMGSRDAREPLSERSVRRQWQAARSGASLRALGVESAEQLAAQFLADSESLRDWSRDVPPLVDDRPGRAPRFQLYWQTPPPAYAAWMDALAARQRFEASDFVARLWPAALRERSLAFFDLQRLVRELLLQPVPSASMGALHRILTRTSLTTLPLWMLASDADRQRIVDQRVADGATGDLLAYQLALRALAQRDYALAAERLAALRDPALPRRLAYRLYALCMAGRIDEARQEVHALDGSRAVGDDEYWRFMQATFGLARPAHSPAAFRGSTS